MSFFSGKCSENRIQIHEVPLTFCCFDSPGAAPGFLEKLPRALCGTRGRPSLEPDACHRRRHQSTLLALLISDRGKLSSFCLTGAPGLKKATVAFLAGPKTKRA